MGRTVTLKGNPLELEGPELKAGDPAPNATLRKNLVTDEALSAYNGQTRIYSVVPSLDTPVCAEQTRRFNKEASAVSGVTFITISMDLPTAMDRFCDAEEIDLSKAPMLSDHMHAEFGRSYGTLVPAMRVLCRAVFVEGPDDKIAYAEYVPEIADHPNYDAVLDAARSL